MTTLKHQPDKIRQARAALEALPSEQFNATHREQLKRILDKPSSPGFFEERQEREAGGPSNPQTPPGPPTKPQ